jgi:hypothetical protein
MASIRLGVSVRAGAMRNLVYRMAGTAKPTRMRREMATDNSGEHVGDHRFSFPSFEVLSAGLESVWDRAGLFPVQPALVGRQENAYASTFGSEVVTCRLVDGSELRLFFKYGFEYLDNGLSRRGVPYEIEVYRQALAPLALGTPRFYGAFDYGTSGSACLVLEFLDDYVHVSTATERDAMRLTARWIGRFHAVNERCLTVLPLSFLNDYSAEYYAAWLGRVSTVRDRFTQRFPWLAGLCKRLDGLVELLLEAPSALIHGELYPSNALIRDGRVCVVDWESAGRGAGELDLAALTQGPWSEDTLQECEQEYRLTRWPHGPPHDFDLTLAAARLHLCFRVLLHWLRLRPDQLEEQPWLFEQMRLDGDRLELL